MKTANDALEEADRVWPPLPLEEWKGTHDTLHMWAQIVGKVKLELSPFLDEWWEVAFAVTARGLTTSTIPWRNGVFEVTFDFIDHNLPVLTSGGAVGEFILRYEDVRRVAAPEQMILDFFESTYAAGATLAKWNRAALERRAPQDRRLGGGE